MSALCTSWSNRVSLFCICIRSERVEWTVQVMVSCVALMVVWSAFLNRRISGLSFFSVPSARPGGVVILIVPV